MQALRFLTCGSVDDGKSTLIGRLLHDAALVPEDVLARLARDSARHGTDGDNLDYALLVDGLAAEREQGITIDVAWRYFSTPRRRFIVADTPGHEQYTRNMATGASQAEMAVVLVDARHGILPQTRRHSRIAAMFGIRHVVLAVNKMDLAGFGQAPFDAVAAAYAEAVRDLGFASVVAIPLCARQGDNVVARSLRMPWYHGPTLLGLLETADVARPELKRPFAMPVQWVNRASEAFRGYAGTIAAGTVRPGDVLRVAASGRTGTVARIVTFDGDRDEAVAGDPVTLVLSQPLDVSRGDVLADAAHPVTMASRLVADVLWLAEEPMAPGRSLVLKLGTATVPASISGIQYRVDIGSFAMEPAESLVANDVARISIALALPVAVEPFASSIELGGFILIDRMTQATIGVGMVVTAQAAATEITWHRMTVDKQARAVAKGQRPVVVWFTGLSGSGKSTIADLAERYLHALGRHTFTLDGDNVRHGLNRDLGFTEADRSENIRRAAEAAKLLLDAGLIVLVSFISPFRVDRAAARALFGAEEFIEVFVDTPLDECRRRDPKGLYRKVDAGLIRNFTGVDAPYEEPEAPELRLRTTTASAEVMAEQVVALLRQRGAFR
ncbi:MAG: adenylyl-sulfate kinase [Acetobacteraceae bacterium]|nr:MAG: adenylyl-sulfate kinase [Acetobacteraceae bacterium]